MSQYTYEQVSKKVDELTQAYKKEGNGFEYAATTGTLNSILSLLIGGEISRKAAFESLEDAIKRANSYSQ